jgi:hypothetical protein
MGEVQQNWMPGVRWATALKTGVADARAAAFQHILASDEPGMDLAEKRFAEAVPAVAAARREVERRVTSEDERTIHSRFDASWASYQAALKEIFGYSRQYAKEAAGLYYNEKAAPFAKGAMSATDDAVALKTRGADAANTRADKAVGGTIRSFTFTLALTLLAAALAAWALATTPGATRVALRTKRRAGRASLVMAALDSGGTPRAFLKLSNTAEGKLDRARLDRTAAHIAALGPGARAAGARVPESRVMTTAGGLAALIETPLTGETAQARLERGSIAPRDAVETLAAWLGRWHEATAVGRVLDAPRLEHEVLRPAAAVVPSLADGSGYQVWLEERCQALTGATVPLVATHGDLTMSNVLLAPGHAPGIVDWEASSPAAFPLRDLWYAAADAEAAPGRYRDRLGAFERSRMPSAPTGRVVAEAADRIQRALRLSPEFVTLCRHACWLQHAADEQTKRGAGEARPFLAILQRLAAERAA